MKALKPLDVCYFGMSSLRPPPEDRLVGPSGREYRLASEALPPLEQAHANRDTTRQYLLDLMAEVRRRAPPELFPIQLVGALGEALRTMPAPWLREFAYAGMLTILQELDARPEQEPE